MTRRMGRLTKRNRTKYRRRAYAAGMSRRDERAPLHLAQERGRIPVVAPVAARDAGGRHDADDKRAA